MTFEEAIDKHPNLMILDPLELVILRKGARDNKDLDLANAVDAVMKEDIDAKSKWRPFTENYTKDFYSVRFPGGKVVKNCWPNAGKIHVEGRDYTPSSNIEVRKQWEFIEEGE